MVDLPKKIWGHPAQAINTQHFHPTNKTNLRVRQIKLLTSYCFSCFKQLEHILDENCYTHFTPVYRIKRKRIEGSFSHSINDKHCLSFIVDRKRKHFFHSLPSNSVHRCEMGIIVTYLIFFHDMSHIGRRGKNHRGTQINF